MYNRILNLDLPRGQSLFLWGARKTGKTTFLKQKYPESVRYDFLRHDDMLLYTKNPSLIREHVSNMSPQNLEHPIILDEVQKIPGVLDEVHWMIENIPGAHFILCGSSMRRLKMEGSNLLGGRAWRQLFMPLVYPEIGTLNLLKILNNGLLPSHYLHETYPKRSLAGYVTEYIIPEVQHEGRLRRLDTLARFLEVASFSNAEMVNFTNIAADTGVSTKTIQSYFEILNEMWLGYYLQPFAKQRSRQLITHAPKFYFFDPGVANYLKGTYLSEVRGADAGKSFETYIFLELLAYKELMLQDYDLCYWRTKGGAEVDFVLNKGTVAIEAKISTPIEKRDLKGLVLFGQEYGATLHVVSLEPRKRVMSVEDQKITIWPVEEFLNTLWSGKLF